MPIFIKIDYELIILLFVIMYSDFKTQKQLKQCVREKIDKIGVCHSIKQYYPEEWEEFIYLFKRHSDYP